MVSSLDNHMKDSKIRPKKNRYMCRIVIIGSCYGYQEILKLKWVNGDNLEQLGRNETQIIQNRKIRSPAP